MNSAILINLFFILLFANTCTCLLCNNGTAYVNNDGAVTPLDNNTIPCTTQFCVVNGIKRLFLFLYKRLMSVEKIFKMSKSFNFF
jgi:hypothetical protein